MVGDGTGYWVGGGTGYWVGGGTGYWVGGGTGPGVRDGVTEVLRVGVVGASYAAGTHLPTYAVLPEVEVVAVATAHAETAAAVAERFGIPRSYAGFAALCADPDVDVVDVATRPSRHRPMVEAALAAGKHVLCEVPLAPSSAVQQPA